MKLMVLDGNSVINRAYYGVRALTTRDGFFTNAIYGFLNILEKLRADEKPDALCVAFDLKAPTFRHLKYDGYKATRHPMPDELAMQMPVMKDVLRAMRIPIFECEGWEADDVIGTIGKRCGHAGWDCVIVTGDRDSLQLIDEHVTVKLVSSKLSQTVAVNYDPAKFREEYGFEPIHLIDLKALMGDSSDNIPGVAGVGPKTATQLLLDYGTLDGVYAHLDAVKEKLRAKLEQGRDSAYLSYDLATIRCEAPIKFSPEACLVQPYDEAALYELFARLEFTRLIARYGLHAPQETAENGMIDGVCTSEVVSDAARAEALAASFQKEHYVNLIAEPDLSAIAVNTDESGYYFYGDALESTKFMSTLFGVSVKKVTHDCKPLMRRLLELGYPAESFIFDTALAAYDLDATQGSYDLDRVVTHLLGFEIGRADKDEVGEEAARVCNRLAEASAVAALYEALPEKLAQNGMEKLYYEIELPLCRVLAEMEYAGVKADQMALISFGNMLQSRIEAAQQTIFDFAGREFNINSTKQLGEILFDELGLPAGKKTKSGYSTNADVLEKLKGKHPIIEAILDYRAMTKHIIKDLSLDLLSQGIWGKYDVDNLRIDCTSDVGTGKFITKHLFNSDTDSFLIQTAGNTLSLDELKLSIYGNVYPGRGHIINTLLYKRSYNFDGGAEFILHGWSVFSAWHIYNTAYTKYSKVLYSKINNFLLHGNWQDSLTKMYYFLLGHFSKQEATRLMIMITQYPGKFESYVMGALATEQLIVKKFATSPMGLLDEYKKRNLADFFALFKPNTNPC